MYGVPTSDARIARLPPHSMPVASTDCCLRRVARHREVRVRDRAPEILHRERAQLLRAEIAREHRAAKALQAGARIERALDRGEIAVADDRDRLLREAPLQAVEIESVQDARRPVAAAHRQHDIGQAARRIGETVQVGGALAVGAAETLEAPLRRVQVFQPMSLRTQAIEPPLDRCGIVRISGRRDEIDGAGLDDHGISVRVRMPFCAASRALRASRSARASCRRSAKKLRSAWPHSSASTPPTTVV